MAHFVSSLKDVEFLEGFASLSVMRPVWCSFYCWSM